MVWRRAVGEVSYKRWCTRVFEHVRRQSIGRSIRLREEPPKSDRCNGDIALSLDDRGCGSNGYCRRNSTPTTKHLLKEKCPLRAFLGQTPPATIARGACVSPERHRLGHGPSLTSSGCSHPQFVASSLTFRPWRALPAFGPFVHRDRRRGTGRLRSTALDTCFTRRRSRCGC